MEEIQIVPMGENHIKNLWELEVMCFSVPWSIYSLKAILLDERSIFLVAMIEDTVAGYAGIHWVLDEANLDNMAVHPKYQGTGIGRKLLDALIIQCKKLKISTLMLEVRTSNNPAIHLYKSVGFVQVGLRKDYYTNPTEDAFLMNLQLKRLEATCD